jgi:phospholipid transport system substrate-binding protein
MEASRPIEELDTALLAVMKAGSQAHFSMRFAMLALVVEQVFDWSTVPQSSVGMRWATMAPDEQTEFRNMLRRYTIASYVANFDNYTGQRFQVSPSPRRLGNGDIIVQTQLVETTGSHAELDYVMRKTSSGWKVIDVLADGSISRVAVQRSDFRGLLARGGVPALIASLARKVTELSGGIVQ